MSTQCGCRHARDGSVISMFGTSAYQYNPRHSAAPSEMPRGIKMEHNSDTTVAAVPQTDDLIKLGKRKAWAKFLAYEVCALVIHLYFTRSMYKVVPEMSDLLPNRSSASNVYGTVYTLQAICNTS